MADTSDDRSLGGDRRRRQSLAGQERTTIDIAEKKAPRDGKVNEGLNET